jgi:deoxyribonuclease (pyrimidine dimer)
MTRINCIPVEFLIDQHLLAEYREMLRIPAALRKSMKAGRPVATPLFYKMSEGHIKFFYDKGEFLRKRHIELKSELKRRGLNHSDLSLSLSDFRHYGFMGDWDPDYEAMLVNTERLLERIDGMKNEPRYCGNKISRDEAKEMAKKWMDKWMS